MALEQESKFELNLELGESYIYGTAFTSDNSYSINIQQASNNLIVLQSDLLISKSRVKHQFLLDCLGIAIQIKFL